MQQHLPFTVLKLQTGIARNSNLKLQQHLPFTVLKLYIKRDVVVEYDRVATALTVYGIETFDLCSQLEPAAHVATALTVYGIETSLQLKREARHIWLQQHLPFTVLKPTSRSTKYINFSLELQQHLPFTVLKLETEEEEVHQEDSCNSTYRLRY